MRKIKRSRAKKERKAASVGRYFRNLLGLDGEGNGTAKQTTSSIATDQRNTLTRMQSDWSHSDS